MTQLAPTTELLTTQCVAMDVFGAMRVVVVWMAVCGDMREGLVVILRGDGDVEGRAARWREVWRRRWGVSTRRIRGDEAEGEVGWM